MKIHYTLHYTLHYTRCNALELVKLVPLIAATRGVITSGQGTSHQMGNNARIHIPKEYRASRAIAISTEMPSRYITATPSVL